MTSSRWHAHGNVYLVAEGDYELDQELDGAIEVRRVDGNEVAAAIVNPDGAYAEMSGHGTRIAGAWLMERTGASRARVHVGPRVVDVRRAGDEYESELGTVEVVARERIAGLDVTVVSVGNP